MNTSRFLFTGAIVVSLVYLLSNPHPRNQYDYTFRVAQAFLNGHLGLTQEPPNYLDEFVPVNGTYYSVFPLGAILTMLPAGALKEAGLIKDFPSSVLSAVMAGLMFIFCYGLASLFDLSSLKKLFVSLVPVFGTWGWANMVYGAAWQTALGVALFGQLGALYFLLVQNNPLIAGLFFSLAFGNRTELILLAPLFVYLIYVKHKSQPFSSRPYLMFLIIPFILGVLTLLYNYVRFDSAFDFGYARIPHVLSEPWYKHGIFSLHAIPANLHTMLIQGWRYVGNYPFFIPEGLGNSILLSSPFLVLLFRENSRYPILKTVSWIAIGLITFTLFIHGNTGGWQFSYRYGMSLIPWIYLLILNNSPRKIMPIEIIFFCLSMLINAWAVYLWYWTPFVR